MKLGYITVALLAVGGFILLGLPLLQRDFSYIYKWWIE